MPKPNTDSPSFIANYYNGLDDKEAIAQLAKMGIKFEPKKAE